MTERLFMNGLQVEEYDVNTKLSASQLDEVMRGTGTVKLPKPLSVFANITHYLCLEVGDIVTINYWYDDVSAFGGDFRVTAKKESKYPSGVWSYTLAGVDNVDEE